MYIYICVGTTIQLEAYIYIYDVWFLFFEDLHRLAGI
jgi:hypothetical protein